MQKYKKKILGSGKRPLDLALPNNTILIISNDEMEHILKIVKSLEDSGILLKGVSETIKNEVKDQEGGFQHVIRYIRCTFIRRYVIG